MNKNQKAFWSMLIGFCCVATSFLYSEGVFQVFDIGTAMLLAMIYLFCAVPIYLYVKKDKINLKVGLSKVI
jgi:hypothetical protein